MQSADLRRILLNPIYTGWRIITHKGDPTQDAEELCAPVWDETLQREVLKRKHRRRILRDPEEVIRVKVLEPGLVPEALFQHVGQLLRDKTDSIHQAHLMLGPSQPWVYTGMLFCGKCGSPLYSRVRNRASSYYVCRDRIAARGGSSQCEAPNMRRPELEEKLNEFFHKQFTNEKFLGAIVKSYQSDTGNGTSAHRKVYLTQQRDSLLAKRGRIADSYNDGVYGKAERDRRLAQVDEALAANERQLAELPEHVEVTNEGLAELLAPLFEWPHLGRDERRKLLAARFQKIAVADYRVTSLFLVPGSGPPCGPSQERSAGGQSAGNGPSAAAQSGGYRVKPACAPRPPPPQIPVPVLPREPLRWPR